MERGGENERIKGLPIMRIKKRGKWREERGAGGTEADGK